MISVPTLMLIHPCKILTVSVPTLMLKCIIFTDDPVLTGVPYSVRAPVSVDDFRQFIFALEGKDTEVRNVNFGGLSVLCDEFRFNGLSESLSAFQQSASFKGVAAMEASEARLRHSALEERLLQRDYEFALPQCEVARQSQAQESMAAALTDALSASIRPPNATETPRVPAAVRTPSPSPSPNNHFRLS
jgi:hypothetical protein